MEREREKKNHNTLIQPCRRKKNVDKKKETYTVTKTDNRSFSFNQHNDKE